MHAPYFAFMFNQEESRKQSLNEDITLSALKVHTITFLSALTRERFCVLTISSSMGCNFQPIMKIVSALADSILIYIIHDSAWLNLLAKSFKDKFVSRAQVCTLCKKYNLFINKYFNINGLTYIRKLKACNCFAEQNV